MLSIKQTDKLESLGFKNDSPGSMIEAEDMLRFVLEHGYRLQLVDGACWFEKYSRQKILFSDQTMLNITDAVWYDDVLTGLYKVSIRILKQYTKGEGDE